MSSVNKVRKLFEYPYKFRVCHQPNPNASRQAESVSVQSVGDALEDNVQDLSSYIDGFTIQDQPDPQVGFRFFLWTALRSESLRKRASLDFVSELLVRNNWFALYREALENIKKCGILVTNEPFQVLIRHFYHLV